MGPRESVDCFCHPPHGSEVAIYVQVPALPFPNHSFHHCSFRHDLTWFGIRRESREEAED